MLVESPGHCWFFSLAALGIYRQSECFWQLVKKKFMVQTSDLNIYIVPRLNTVWFLSISSVISNKKKWSEFLITWFHQSIYEKWSGVCYRIINVNQIKNNPQHINSRSIIENVNHFCLVSWWENLMFLACSLVDRFSQILCKVSRVTMKKDPASW